MAGGHLWRTHFGIGIVLAGGCATGTWYRTGKGLIGSWIALFGYMFGGAMTYYSLFKPLNEMLSGPRTDDIYIYETLGISPWVLTNWRGVLAN